MTIVDMGERSTFQGARPPFKYLYSIYRVNTLISISLLMIFERDILKAREADVILTVLTKVLEFLYETATSRRKR